MRLRRSILSMLTLCLMASLPIDMALAQNLPLPRMVSLRADEVNVRSGPDLDHPIMWVFKRRAMPVEIVAEFEVWRKIRDWEGAEGWVHRAMLSGSRSLIIQDEMLTMRQDATDHAPAVARLARGMVVHVDHCGPDWCEVEVRGYEGWIPRIGTWGLYPNEVID